MVIVDTDRGLVEADVPRDDDASVVGTHHAAIQHYLATGDTHTLDALTGMRLYLEGESYELETRPWRIEDLALDGDLGYDDIYALE